MFFQHWSSRTICPHPKTECLLFEVTSIVKADIFTFEQQGKELTSFLFETYWNTFASLGVQNLWFPSFLPWLDKRRSLLDIGGTVLTALFGTGTISELHQLHGVLLELKYRNSDLIHPWSNQVTFVKKLDTITAINIKAIANLTTIIKDNIVVVKGWICVDQNWTRSLASLV